MKSYTDLEQSKALAKILPIDSADMEYMFLKKDNSMVSEVPFVKDGYEEPDCPYNMVHCWSLTALLNILPYPQLSKDKLGSGKEGWMVSVYPNDCRYDSCWHDNPVDACVAMIERLHELNLL
jgi:hypothetical protein